jgi:hypothetical protein
MTRGSRPRIRAALVALCLMAMAAGLRLGEWTLCFEPDGRRHAESSLADCPGDVHSNDDSCAPGAESSLAPYDCVSCVDLEFSLTALRPEGGSEWTPLDTPAFMLPHAGLPPSLDPETVRTEDSRPPATDPPPRHLATTVLTC